MDKNIKINYLIFSLIIVALSGCSISFQNIDTHGTATDLVEETQSATPTVSPNISIPPIPM